MSHCSRAVSRALAGPGFTKRTLGIYARRLQEEIEALRKCWTGRELAVTREDLLEM